MSRAKKPSDIAADQPQSDPSALKQRAIRVLLIDQDASTIDTVVQALGNQQHELYQTDHFDQADDLIRRHRPDVVLLGSDGANPEAFAWVSGLQQTALPPSAIMLSGERNFEHLADFIQAGGTDVLTKPLDAEQLRLRVAQSASRSRQYAGTVRRYRKLRKVCRNLTQARKQVSDQVDMLCGDLVNAYQELAEQVQHVVQTTEYSAVVGGELDLEQVLRKTLEFLLEKAGPTNAAVFLPSTLDEFSLGGYVNYDWSAGSPELLLQHLADGVAPKVASTRQLLHLTSKKEIQSLLGDDSEYLADCNILAACCRHDQEPLAVIILFRDRESEFDDDVVETLGGIAPLLGDYLARVIRIHHRGMPNPPFGSSSK